MYVYIHTYIYDWIYEKIDELILIAQRHVAKPLLPVYVVLQLTRPILHVPWASLPLHKARFLLSSHIYDGSQQRRHFPYEPSFVVI